MTNPGSDAVAAFAINGATGVLAPVAGSPFAAGLQPSAIAMYHPSGRYLYVRNVGAPNVPGSVSAYSIDSSTGALSAIGSPAAIGANSTYMVVHPTGRFLLVANGPIPSSQWGPGSISVLSVDAASGGLTATQTPLTPAPYSVAVDPSGRFVYAASVVGNVHYSFELDAATGALTPIANGAVIVSRDQPISLIAYNSPTSPNAATLSSRFAYAANSGDNTISGYAINAATGALTGAAPVASAGNGPRAVAVHPRNRFVVGVNDTNQNDLASYGINSPGGALSAASSTIWTGGHSPVALAIHPNGRSVHLAHTFGAGANPERIGAFALNPVTGALSSIDLPSFNGVTTFTLPTSVAFAPSGRFMYYTTNTHYGWARIDDDTGGYAGGNGSGALGAPGKSAMVVHPSGRFAYITLASDPGVIERYSVHTHTGVFSFLGNTASGAFPRAITIDPTGRFAYTANSANSVSMFTINQATGVLTSIGADVPAGTTPVAIAADYSGRYVHVLSQGTEQILTYAINQTSGALTLIAAAPAATGDMPSSLAVTRDIQ